MSDIYLQLPSYERLVKRVRESLARDWSDEQRRAAVKILLAGLGIPDAGRVERLLDALVDLEASPWTDRFDDCDVKILLGEKGNIWPAHLLPHAAEIGLPRVKARAMRNV